MFGDARLPPRFWSKIKADASTGCWLWTANRDPDGYARMTVGSRTDGSRRLASCHVLAYETLVAAVPDGLELDHRCEVRHCVNPDHLEPVTHRINVLRGKSPSAKAAAAIRCPLGHLYDVANTVVRDGRRDCRSCRDLHSREYRERNREHVNSQARARHAKNSQGVNERRRHLYAAKEALDG